MSPIGSHTTKNIANWVLHNQKPVSRPDKQVEEKEKPQVRGCRTLVQRGTGRQDSPGRGDGLGWTTSTPPDSNGVPRDVPDSPELCTHPTKMSVFRAHRRKVSATSRIATGGKPARRSKPAQSRPDRPWEKQKPHGRRWADLGKLYQAARIPWGVRAPRGRPYACAQKHTGPSGPPSGPEGSQEVRKILSKPSITFQGLSLQLKNGQRMDANLNCNELQRARTPCNLSKIWVGRGAHLN